MELIPTELFDRILFATPDGAVQVQLILRSAGAAEIHHLEVNESHRRRGLATQALNELETIAQRMRILKLTVAVDASNAAARKLYEKLDYVVTDETEGEKPTDRRIVMFKHLKL